MKGTPRVASPLTLVLAACLASACARSIARGEAGGVARPHPYALPHPVDRPVPMAGGKLRTVNGIAFTAGGDTLFTSEWQEDRDSTGRRRLRIVEWRHEGGEWRGPLPVSFSSAFTDYQPVFGPDRRRLYFQSTRPLPGTSNEVLQNLWYVERRGGGWTEPRPIAELNTPAREGYAAPVLDGTIYFTSDRPGGRGGHDFYRAARRGDSFAAPEPVRELNSTDSENDLFVDYAGRFVIFNRYVDSTRSIDLFVSVRRGDRWGEPRALDDVNTDEGGPRRWELTPSVTPDGRYLLFTLDATIMQVDLGAVLYEDEVPGVGRRRRGNGESGTGNGIER